MSEKGGAPKAFTVLSASANLRRLSAPWFVYGLEIPDRKGGRFIARYVFEDAQDAQDAADEIEVEKYLEPVTVIRMRLIHKGGA